MTTKIPCPECSNGLGPDGADPCEVCHGTTQLDSFAALLTTDQVADLSVTSVRQVRYWHTIGVARCSGHAEGSGNPWRWSLDDAEQIALIGRLPESWDVATRGECARSLLAGTPYRHGVGGLYTSLHLLSWQRYWRLVVANWFVPEVASHG